MSFSSNVKRELSRQIEIPRHCQIAEIAGIINMCGKILDLSGNVSIKIQTENAAVARKSFTLLKKAFNINTEVLIRRNTQLKKNRSYILEVTDTDLAKKVLLATGIVTRQGEKLKKQLSIDPLLIQHTCCKRAYIRGAFLGGGSVSDPEKTYHLEFVNTTQTHSKQLQALINSFGMDAKTIPRKKNFIVYLKEGEQIVEILNIMEAHIALMDLENIRIIKEMRNNVNRMVNCETANLKKTVSAAVRQVEDITYIDQVLGLHNLPPQLEEVAQYRLQHQDASLKELGTYLNPPVGKSGVNHRLRKINEIAERLKEERGGLS
ncbi:MAG: DNA-binding protein WhiA [Epulopiscium sp.]|nr:DNA-binding protein WhiA [Candidatus Epulonipiscium sp.]